jgi:hypothetical protein
VARLKLVQGIFYDGINDLGPQDQGESQKCQRELNICKLKDSHRDGYQKGDNYLDTKVLFFFPYESKPFPGIGEAFKPFFYIYHIWTWNRKTSFTLKGFRRKIRCGGVYWTALELISSLIRLKDHPRTPPHSG